MKTVKSLATLMTVAMLGCGNQTPPQADNQAPAAEDDAAASAAPEKGTPITLNGAGATFPFPIYSKWAHMYNKGTGARLNYQSIRSGGGIA